MSLEPGPVQTDGRRDQLRHPTTIALGALVHLLRGVRIGVTVTVERTPAPQAVATTAMIRPRASTAGPRLRPGTFVPASSPMVAAGTWFAAPERVDGDRGRVLAPVESVADLRNDLRTGSADRPP
ncbi:hypothetical protein Ate01nite_68730 [Actinoplanes teichomyceticus]|nr:hypothetical protein Ate01nite_68730 [Actinoplanes teichomyceticus]